MYSKENPRRKDKRKNQKESRLAFGEKMKGQLTLVGILLAVIGLMGLVVVSPIILNAVENGTSGWDSMSLLAVRSILPILVVCLIIGILSYGSPQRER